MIKVLDIRYLVIGIGWILDIQYLVIGIGLDTGYIILGNWRMDTGYIILGNLRMDTGYIILGYWNRIGYWIYNTW